MTGVILESSSAGTKSVDLSYAGLEGALSARSQMNLSLTNQGSDLSSSSAPISRTCSALLISWVAVRGYSTDSGSVLSSMRLVEASFLAFF